MGSPYIICCLYCCRSFWRFFVLAIVTLILVILLATLDILILEQFRLDRANIALLVTTMAVLAWTVTLGRSTVSTLAAFIPCMIYMAWNVAWVAGLYTTLVYSVATTILWLALVVSISDSLVSPKNIPYLLKFLFPWWL